MADSIIGQEPSAQTYREMGYWGDETPSELCDRNARLYPTKVAVVDSTDRLTWEQVKIESDGMALRFLELGLKKDDIVLVQLPNTVDLFLTLLAFEKAGIIALGCAPTFRRAEIEPIVRHAGVVGAVVPARYGNFDYCRMLKDIKQVQPSLRYLMVSGDRATDGAIPLKDVLQRNPREYSEPDFQDTRIGPLEIFRLGTTSGSTGAPKIMESALCPFFCTAKVWAKRAGFTHEDVVGALYSVAGGGVAMLARGVAALFGAKVALLEHFSPREACELIEKEGVTVLAGVPAAFAKILSYPDIDKYDFSKLRLAYNSTSILPYEIGLAMEEKFECKVVQSYGAMDCGSVTCTSVDDPRDVRLGTVGRPYDYSEMKLVNERGEDQPPGESGEVVVRGAHLDMRYFRNEELTRKNWINGWFKIGDLGRLDENGNLKLEGRKDDLIIRGGRNILPREVEDFLIQHPKIAEVAVVRIPDPIMGEKACACVVPKPGQSLTFEEMVSFLRSRDLAPFKLPERLEVLDKLPMVAAGQKINRKELEKYMVQRLNAQNIKKPFASKEGL